MLFSTAKYYLRLIVTIFLSTSLIAPALARENFNILGWANVFDISDSIINKVKNIEETCNVDISYDTYSNYNDFITQLSNHDYDYNILLIPNTYLNFVTKHMHKTHNNALDDIINSYNPVIKNHFKTIGNTSNITYFAQSITGILINRDKITSDNINTLDDLITAIKDDDMLIVLDDPIELSSLIESNREKRISGNKNTSDIINNIKKFKSQIGTKDITIVNFYNKRMDEKDFAAAISWSGEAIRDISIVESNSRRNLDFITPKNLSIISSDILVQLRRDKATDCAMKLFSSKDFVDEANYQMNYFSPFISDTSLRYKNKYYHNIQKQYLSVLPKANWLDSVNKDGFTRVMYEWDKLKFNAIKNKVKNQDKEKS